MTARECYIAMLEMDDHLQTLSIKEQRMVAELVEGLEEILLDHSKPEQMTRISTFASPPIRQALATFLRENQDVFAWSHEDMSGIDPSVMVHRLNVLPSFPLVYQKKRVFVKEESVCPRTRQSYSERGSQVARYRVHKGSILYRLASQHGNGKKD